MKWQWGWYQEQMHNKLFLTFLVEQFFFALIFLPFLLYRPLRAAIAQSYAIWIEILLIGAAIGVAAAQLTIDSSGGYFIDVHMYLALPVLLLALTDCDIRGRFSAAINVWSSRAYQFVIIVIIVSGLYSLVKLLPNFIRDFSRDRSLVLQHLDYHNPYSALFQHIRDDHEERYMVYIPKTEKYFWENTDDTYTRWAKHQCIKMPFYLPIATGKPALFGLPDPARNCYTFHRGYESYSEQEYRDSAALNYDDDALCRAVLAKGFDGVYRVTLAAGVVKQRCRN